MTLTLPASRMHYLYATEGGAHQIGARDHSPISERVGR